VTTVQPAPAGPATAQGPILEVRDLHVHFAARRGRGPVARAVDGVDLQVQPGEIVALAGESGCGKTTLARAILGLVEPTSGQVLYRGEPIGRGTAALKPYRREVQLVLQDPTGALNPRQSVYESVAEGLRIHGVKGDEETLVADALARSGLRPPRRFFLAYPHELSGGQRQRVVIAGALALEPSMLVADEPVSSLDASVRGEILALLLGLVRDLGLSILVADEPVSSLDASVRGEILALLLGLVRDLGLSILVVTHDLGLAWNIADRLAVMYLGRIVEQGPTETVLADPRHPYTRALLSVVPEVRHVHETQILTGEPPDPTRVPGGCRFHPRCPALASGAAARAGVDDRCRNEPVPILSTVAEHHAACFLTDESVKTEGGSRVGR
jgi:oligopeptide/dipeptide ABC transporter ATP-binding protein